jgi:hypothetical protein
MQAYQLPNLSTIHKIFTTPVPVARVLDTADSGRLLVSISTEDPISAIIPSYPDGDAEHLPLYCSSIRHGVTWASQRPLFGHCNS